MTPRQKLIVITLGIANILVIATLATLVIRTHNAHSTPPPPATLLRAPEECQWQAAQLLARAGLGGQATLSPGSPLHLDIVYPHTSAQAITASIEEAAQSIWTAFDVAVALQQSSCTISTQVKVTVLIVPSNSRPTTRAIPPDAQLNASVSMADLLAFHTGQLDESAFIERVTYVVDVQ